MGFQPSAARYSRKETPLTKPYLNSDLSLQKVFDSVEAGRLSQQTLY
jgi:hypothetical protein